MAKVYIQRGEDGVIKGEYTLPQPQADGTFLTEPNPVEDTDPELLSFRKRMEEIFGK